MQFRIPTAILTPMALCSLAVLAGAQGADDCANAQPISGTGTFQYNTLNATTDGPSESFWSIPGLDSMDNDVWFSWQAPKTAVYRVHNCMPTNNVFTFMAVYRFGCPPTSGRAVAAEEATCSGLAFTSLELGTEAGATYLIRIGHSVPQNRDAGTFKIEETGHPGILASAVNPANGRTYHFLEESAWTVAQAAAVALGGNLVTVNDQAENDWLDATFSNWGGKARSFWIGYSDAEVEGVWTWASGEVSSYTNWSPGAPNNGNSYEHYAHFRYDHKNGTWGDLLGFPRAGFFYKEVHGVVEVNNPSPLVGTPPQISVSAGGSQSLILNAGAGEASALYLVMGTLSGTQPGFPVGGQLLPLNVDLYTLHTIQSPNTPPLFGSLGVLDVQGHANASFTLGAGQAPSLAGMTAHHAFVTFFGINIATVSNPVAVDFIP